MEEIWSLVEDKYEISNKGRVRSNGSLILKTRLDRYGYELVTFWVDGVCLTRKVHRLVATAFIPNPEELPTVNHIDGIKTNNCVTNLEWLSVGDNHRHAISSGLRAVGENRIGGRPVALSNADIPVIREMIAKGMGNTAIGKAFGVSCGCIYSIRVGKSWTHI